MCLEKIRCTILVIILLIWVKKVARLIFYLLKLSICCRCQTTLQYCYTASPCGGCSILQHLSRCSLHSVPSTDRVQSHGSAHHARHRIIAPAPAQRSSSATTRRHRVAQSPTTLRPSPTPAATAAAKWTYASSSSALDVQPCTQLSRRDGNGGAPRVSEWRCSVWHKSSCRLTLFACCSFSSSFVKLAAMRGSFRFLRSFQLKCQQPKSFNLNLILIFECRALCSRHCPVWRTS